MSSNKSTINWNYYSIVINVIPIDVDILVRYLCTENWSIYI